jgi:hypothetical protein
MSRMCGRVEGFSGERPLYVGASCLSGERLVSVGVSCLIKEFTIPVGRGPDLARGEVIAFSGAGVLSLYKLSFTFYFFETFPHDAGMRSKLLSGH